MLCIVVQSLADFWLCKYAGIRWTNMLRVYLLKMMISIFTRSNLNQLNDSVEMHGQSFELHHNSYQVSFLWATIGYFQKEVLWLCAFLKNWAAVWPEREYFGYKIRLHYWREESQHDFKFSIAVEFLLAISSTSSRLTFGKLQSSCTPVYVSVIPFFFIVIDVNQATWQTVKLVQ